MTTKHSSVRALSPAEYAKARAAALKQVNPAPVPVKPVSEMTNEEHAATLPRHVGLMSQAEYNVRPRNGDSPEMTDDQVKALILPLLMREGMLDESYADVLDFDRLWVDNGGRLVAPPDFPQQCRKQRPHLFSVRTNNSISLGILS